MVQTSISDHFLIYAIRNSRPIKGSHKTIDYRCFKNFNEHMFVDALFKVP